MVGQIHNIATFGVVQSLYDRVNNYKSNEKGDWYQKYTDQRPPSALYCDVSDGKTLSRRLITRNCTVLVFVEDPDALSTFIQQGARPLYYVTDARACGLSRHVTTPREMRFSVPSPLHNGAESASLTCVRALIRLQRPYNSSCPF